MGTKFMDMLKAAEDVVDAHESRRSDARETQVNMPSVSEDPTQKKTLLNLQPISMSPECAKRTYKGLPAITPDGVQNLNADDLDLIESGEPALISNTMDYSEDLSIEAEGMDFDDEGIDLDMDHIDVLGAFGDVTAGISVEEPKPDEALVARIRELEAQVSAMSQQLEEMSSQKAAAEGRASQLQEKLVRSTADFDNYRKRVARDQEMYKFQAEKGIITDFLGVLDNLERALQHSKQTHDFDNLLHGVELTAKLYVSALGKHGCVPFNSLGETFDPAYHDVLTKTMDDTVPNNTIVQEHLKGYVLHDVLLRPAMVVVAQNDSAGPSEDSDPS